MKKIIQLIGIQNSTYCSIKKKLEEITQSLHQNVVVEEVVEVDEIMHYNLRRIPAIAVNKKVIFQQKNKPLELEELTLLLQSHL